jgi:hypothetical protein
LSEDTCIEFYNAETYEDDFIQMYSSKKGIISIWLLSEIYSIKKIFQKKLLFLLSTRENN